MGARNDSGLPNNNRINAHFSLQWHQTDATESLLNGINAERLQDALSADCTAPCVPVNLFGPAGSISPAMLDWLTTSGHIKGKSTLGAASVDLDWMVGTTAAGDMEMAAGFEYRHEELDTQPDSILSNNLYVAGGNRGASSGERDVFKAYAELYLPLLAEKPAIDQLSAQFALRYSHYDNFGGKLNPRVVVNWEAFEAIQFRASLGRGFRAPTPNQLHAANQQSFEQLNDPCSLQQNIGTFLGCTQQSDETLTQFQTITGGNQNLEPERSETLSLGTVVHFEWQRLNLEASIDWYKIAQKDVVDSSAQFVVNQNARSGLFADRISRNANGNLEEISATLQNIGRRWVEGFDLALSMRHEDTRLGALTLSINATHIASFKDKFDPDSPTVDKSGTFSDEASGGLGALPDWKWNFGLGWKKSHWQAYYSVYHVSETDETVPIFESQRTIKAWTTNNLNMSYLGPLTRWIRITLGANNIFDRVPPFSAAAFNDSYDGRTYDITGRYYYLKLDRSF